MESKYVSSAEEMLEKIFYYMNRLVLEKDFSAAIILLTDLGRTLVNADRASFWYRDTKNNQYWTIAASDTDKIIVSKGIGIIGASIENNETILLNDPYNDARFNAQVDKDTGYVTKSILCVPVSNGYGEVIGAYQVINKLNQDGISRFGEQDVKRLALAAGYCGKLLETHLLRQQYQIDPLTGLKNRRAFYDCYESYVLAKETSQQTCMIMCDIDFFKKVNDQYGHNGGDMVLVHVSDILRQKCCLCGEVFRWGGEEFIILLPDMDIKKATEHAECIRQTIMNTECNYENHRIKITMSFGVSELDKKVSPELNVRVADDRLYKAKTEGRNRVVNQ